MIQSIPPDVVEAIVLEVSKVMKTTPSTRQIYIAEARAMRILNQETARQMRAAGECRPVAQDERENRCLPASHHETR